MTDRPGSGGSGGPIDVAALRARLRDLQAARAELPPHSAQGWREDLDAQIDRVRRRIAAATRETEGPGDR